MNDITRAEVIEYAKEKRHELIEFWEDYKHENREVRYYDFIINSLETDQHTQNIQAYAHDFGVSEEQAEKELRVTTKNDLGVDCISRSTLLEKQYRIDDSATLSTRDVVNVEDIEDEPPVYPKSDKPSGKWIERDDGWGGNYYDCSVCGESWTTIDGTPFDNGMKYCPHCGAKMIEEQQGEQEHE